MGQKVFWCKKCVVMSTRPRVTFNEEGVLENIEVSQLEPVTLKGFSHPISIYKVTALKGKE